MASAVAGPAGWESLLGSFDPGLAAEWLKVLYIPGEQDICAGFIGGESVPIVMDIGARNVFEVSQ